jgi:uncharacterized protein YjiS (DUF1127 family)
MRKMHRWSESFALLRNSRSAYIPIIETTPGQSGHAKQLTSQRPGKGIIMNVARSINAWRKYRQTVNELGRMSNRELNDLGIARDDIRRIARASAAA